MKIPMLPSLSEEGWVTAGDRIADRILSHIFETDASQSVLFEGNILSIPDIIARNNGNARSIANELKYKLTDLYNLYFNSVSVTIDLREIESNKFNMSVHITCMDRTNSRLINVGRLAEYMDTTLARVVRVNNYGADTDE